MVARTFVKILSQFGTFDLCCLFLFSCLIPIGRLSLKTHCHSVEVYSHCLDRRLDNLPCAQRLNFSNESLSIDGSR